MITHQHLEQPDGVNDLYRFQIYIKTKLSITKGDSILQFWTANPSYKNI